LIDTLGFSDTLPLAIDAASLDKAKKVGLLDRPISEFDTVFLDVSEDMIIAERVDYENRCREYRQRMVDNGFAF